MGLTVAYNAVTTILNAAEERRPSHQVIEVESEVIVFGQGVEVGQVEGEKVRRGHATDGTHLVEASRELGWR